MKSGLPGTPEEQRRDLRATMKKHEETLRRFERFLSANERPIRVADADIDVPMVERIAAGEATPNEIVEWLEQRITPIR
jgi:hypothetical protein